MSRPTASPSAAGTQSPTSPRIALLRDRPSFSHEWQGATWLFSSAEHRDLFAADPEAYAPRFGGWCAYALTQGEYAAEVDPESAWTVHEDQLFLNWDEDIRKKWTRDGIEDGVVVGSENWVEVEQQILEGNARYSRKSDSPWKNL